MRLKDLPANQVPFWYQQYVGEVDVVDEDGNLTGETARAYSNPTPARARISPNTGRMESSPFGADISYDKSISTVVRLPIDEYSLLFIDREPVINADGSTDTEPDYYCVVAKNDLTQNVWAIKKIKAVTPNAKLQDGPVL